MTPARLPSLRHLRTSLALVLMAALVPLGMEAPGLLTDRLPSPSSTADPARAVDIQRLHHATLLGQASPGAAIPLLTELLRGSMDDDVRQRASRLLLDCVVQAPAARPERLDATLRYVYVTADDEQLRERALLVLLAHQLDELPPGFRGAFISDILPGVLHAAREHGLPPSVTIAQAIHESGWGRSRLAQDHHNLFGVKATRSQRAVTMATREHDSGEARTVRSRFRSFADLDESIQHHAALLAGDRRYAPAREAWAAWADWRAYLDELAPTYATDPAYAQRIARIVERYELDRWDTIVMAGAAYDRSLES